ncbi:RNA-guided endonuclease InsQ/TnpB family protein [Nonomuraea sp. NPDC004354]
MARTVKRAYKYRFYPTPSQADLLSRTFGCVRLVYNKALDLRRGSHAAHGKAVSYGESSAELTRWKRSEELAFLNEVSSVPLQQALRHLQSAFANFFAGRARYPSFKSRKRSRSSAEFTRSAFTYRDGVLKLAKMDRPLDVRWSRPLPLAARPSTVTVSRDSADRWYVSILVEETIAPLPPVDQAVGVDAGLSVLLTLSTAEKIIGAKAERRDRKRLARAQRNFASKARGSANREKARVKVAGVYGRIVDRRRDHLHKVTTRLVRENQVIAVEDLAARNLMRNTSLARAVADAAWRSLRHMLEYKAAWYGRELVVIDRWLPSSKTCSSCGAVRASMPLDVRSWTCACGAVHDRDVNAAKNILAAGLADR